VILRAGYDEIDPRRTSKVVPMEMPTLDPILRIEFNKAEALPLLPGGSPEYDTVVIGTNRNGKPAP